MVKWLSKIFSRRPLSEGTATWDNIVVHKIDEEVLVPHMPDAVWAILYKIFQIVAEENIACAAGGSLAKHILRVQPERAHVRDIDLYTTVSGVFKIAERLVLDEQFKDLINQGVLRVEKMPSFKKRDVLFGESYKMEIWWKDDEGKWQEEIEIFGADNGGISQIGNPKVRKYFLETRIKGDELEMPILIYVLSLTSLICQYLVVIAWEKEKIEVGQPGKKWSERLETLKQLFRMCEVGMVEEVYQNIENYAGVERLKPHIEDVVGMAKQLY